MARHERRQTPTEDLAGSGWTVQRVAEQAPPSIRVGRVDDPAEAEADRLADAALRVAADHSSAVRRTTDTVRRSAEPAGGDNLSLDRSALGAAASEGRALDNGVRSQMESGFGRSLGDVRVHVGPRSAELSAGISARAFTHGTDVYFGAGEYRPGTPDGDHVIAHELAHTIQSDSDVHRFPASSLTSPVPWKAHVASVFRPGEGISGGVYILTSKDPNAPIKKVVVKPTFGRNGLGLRETPEQLVMGDRALASLFGLRSPVSRVVRKGGSEFADLAEICQPKMPAPERDHKGNPTGPTSLTEAEGFVVMGEVPNAASIGGLADKSATDSKAANDLYRTVFDPSFLGDLGTLCVGDLLLGNMDRIVLGAMNLGNVMVSMQNGRGSLAAIDTAAILPAARPPSAIAKGVAGGGFANVESDLDQGPGAILDGFFETLVERIKQGTKAPDPGGAMPTWELIQKAYAANRDRYLSSFEFGWQSAMVTVLALSNNAKKRKDLLAGLGADPNLGEETLAENMQYIGARADGSDHGAGVAAAMDSSVARYLTRVETARLDVRNDSLTAHPVTAPPSAVYGAEYVRPPSLPTTAQVATFAKGVAGISGEGLAVLNGPYPRQIQLARSDVDSLVGPTKSRGVLSKKDVPRNRNLLGHFVVDGFATLGAANRSVDAMAYALEVSRELAVAAKSPLSTTTADDVARTADLLTQKYAAHQQVVQSYLTQFGIMTKGLPRTSVPDRDRVVKLTANTEKSLDLATNQYSTDTMTDMAKAAKAAQAAAKAKATKSKAPARPKSPAPTRGRR